MCRPPAKHRCLKCVEKSQASEEAKLAARREAQAAGVPKSGKAVGAAHFPYCTTPLREELFLVLDSWRGP